MKLKLPFLGFCTILLFWTLQFKAQANTPKDSLSIQTDSITAAENYTDSINTVFLDDYKVKLAEIENMRIQDSIQKIALEKQLSSLKTTDNLQKEELQKKIDELETKEANRIAQKKAQIESIKTMVKGQPVIGPLNDTLFLIYNRIGSFSASERAQRTNSKIKETYQDDYFDAESFKLVESDMLVDIMYKDIIIMSVYESDALWNNKALNEQAAENMGIIKDSIVKAKKENSLWKVLMRIGFVILILAAAYFVIWGIGKLHSMLANRITHKSDEKLKELSYRGYTFLSVKQEQSIILFIIKVIKWILIILAVYLILPLVFSIFPFTRTWADTLFGFIWTPLRKILLSIWNYLPNVFTILVIFFVFKYLIKFIKYLFSEIASEKLKLSGFYPDWAMPTFHILKVVLYAFAFVMIFPYLPGAGSPIFAGVSVFLGLLVSLGSSSAIANIVAGLVITYMRPFKIGDRIKLGDTTGEVIEKTILVTRLRTIKNEEITIPNSAILTGNTTNYSSFTKNEGLIVHTKVTMGYEFAWEDIHQALIEAALRTEDISPEPKPFVLQTSLDDFYVTYQLNAYIKDANKQAKIYSGLHQNIQDVFNEKGYEILSPHYRAERDGNLVTFPEKYRPKDYQSPAFKVKVEYEESKEQPGKTK